MVRRTLLLIALALAANSISAADVCGVPDEFACRTCSRFAMSAIAASYRGEKASDWKRLLAESGCTFERDQHERCRRIGDGVAAELSAEDVAIGHADGEGPRPDEGIARAKAELPIDAMTEHAAELCQRMNCCPASR